MSCLMCPNSDWHQKRIHMASSRSLYIHPPYSACVESKPVLSFIGQQGSAERLLRFQEERQTAAGNGAGAHQRPPPSASEPSDGRDCPQCRLPGTCSPINALPSISRVSSVPTFDIAGVFSPLQFATESTHAIPCYPASMCLCKIVL